ncbi:unannotated protein [freshwater metagenome]|uniref:Unannotated protein n=1 Tax=freshwater metagenome TaxID=449393 RepID=A0A6J6CN26_9ZZZZ
MQFGAQFSALFISHHGELEGDAGNAWEGSDCILDAIGDLITQRAPSNSESDQNGHDTVIDLHIAQHADVHNGPVEFWIFNRSQGFNDLLMGN